MEIFHNRLLSDDDCGAGERGELLQGGGGDHLPLRGQGRQRQAQPQGVQQEQQRKVCILSFEQG